MNSTDSSVERIGEFLVRIGAISEGQVQEILALQKTEPDRLFGEIAVERGYIKDEAIDRYLKDRA